MSVDELTLSRDEIERRMINSTHDTAGEVWEELFDRLSKKEEKREEKLAKWKERDKQEALNLAGQVTSIPHVKGSETSRKSAGYIKDKAPNLRTQVLTFLLLRDHKAQDGDPKGATDEEIQGALDLDPSTERPRRVELVEMGLVVDSGETRETLKGNESTVWRPVSYIRGN